MNREFFKGKKVLVMGLGRFGGGVDVAKFAAGCGAKVLVTDMAPPEKLRDSIEQLEQFGDIDFHLGSHDRFFCALRFAGRVKRYGSEGQELCADI